MKRKFYYQTLLIGYTLLLTWGIVAKLNWKNLLQIDFTWIHSPRILLEMGNYRPIINFIPYAGSTSYMEVLLNVIAFIPFGLLLAVVSTRSSHAKCLYRVIMFSIFFELFQYVLNIGIADITDVIGNSIGGEIGILASNLVKEKNMRQIKKWVSVVAAVAVLTALPGCGTQNTNTSTKESAFTDEQGNVIKEVKERGLAFHIAPEYEKKGVVVEGYNENLEGYLTARIYYYSPTANEALDTIIDMDPEERTPEVSEEYTKKIQNTSRTLMDIVMIPTDDYRKLIDQGVRLDVITGFSPSEELGENDGYSYIISIPDLDNGELNDEEIKQYQECKDYMRTVKESLTFIPVQLESTDTQLGETMPTFTTIDLKGQEITNDIFSKKKLTVVNVWGTFCSPCIEEMPELEAWSKEMPDDVQIIGIVGDIDGQEDAEHLELAKLIVDKAGVSFTNLIANDDFKDMMGGIIGFPTTFLVDQNGSIVGDPIVGADMSAYKSEVEEYLGE